MNVPPWLQKTAQFCSPHQWLVAALVSVCLAVGSGLFLAVSLGLPLGQPLASWYDRCELFVRDTSRLTFRHTQGKTVKTLDDTVFMAPIGILEPNRRFIWLSPASTALLSVDPSSASLASDGVQQPGPGGFLRVKTPPKVLDPDWLPGT